MGSEHQLESGDRIVIETGCRVGVIYLFASSKINSEGKQVDGFSELSQEDIRILRDDLTRYLLPENR